MGPTADRWMVRPIDFARLAANLLHVAPLVIEGLGGSRLRKSSEG